MSSVSAFDPSLLRSFPQEQEIALPKPQPFAAPVFIHDCVTPLGGETVLSLLLKRMRDADQP